jgi:hypothetical protein
MKAFIVTLKWVTDATVVSHVVMFGENDAEIFKGATLLYLAEHVVVRVERAPWLDRPESTK